MQAWGIGRSRKDNTDPMELVEIIGQEIVGANRDAGVRVMGDILRVNHGITARRLSLDL